MNKLESLSRTSITFSAPASRPHSNQNDRKPRQNGEKNSRELLERSVPVGALNETLSRANIIDLMFASRQVVAQVLVATTNPGSGAGASDRSGDC